MATPGKPELSVHSPRAETPEPGSQQGRRNAQRDIQLLDDDGAISDQLEICLKHIFSKYCSPPPQTRASKSRKLPLLTPPSGAYLSQEGLDAWARDTNGAPFTKETKEELVEFLDVTSDGGLTFEGFVQIYQLQTENDEEETWRDLSNHGFDRSLKLVATREEIDVSESSFELGVTFNWFNGSEECVITENRKQAIMAYEFKFSTYLFHQLLQYYFDEGTEKIGFLEFDQGSLTNSP